MRYLHQVAAHEKFVGSGTYQYFRDGERIKVSESWTIHEFPGGALFYRVDENGRDEDGLNILSEALFNPDGHMERFNVQSFNPKDDKLLLLKADYSFEPDYVQIGRKLQGQEREYSEFDLIDGVEIYIKQTLFMGYTINRIMARNGEAHVFTPQLLSTGENHLLKMIVQQRGTESINVGRKTIEAQKFQIADDVFYWLDKHQIPVKRSYTYDGSLYDVQLVNYAHR